MRTFAQKQNQPHTRVSSSIARSNKAMSGPMHLQRTIGNQAIQRLLRADKAAGTIQLKKDNQPSNNCKTVKTQRWGCDTACSRAGFVDNDTPFTDATGERGKTGCCNKWPPFVESHAITELSLNGVASCKGAMYKKIFKVKFKENKDTPEKEIRIGCTDSTTTDADHELELSPLAAQDLFGSFEFPLNRQVTVCPDGALSSVCELDAKKLNNPHNPAFPRQRDCVEKGCIPQDPFYDCSRYGWPNV
jgi:hypothetical protein